MRAALVVYVICRELEQNLAAMERATAAAATDGAQLVLFSEAAPTGLVNDDNPEHDLPVGSPIPGPISGRWARIAQETGTYLAAGLLEREGNCLYDSAVLFSPAGELLLHYRRIQPQWHGRGAAPKVYRQGCRVPGVTTPLGRCAILICGDLFDDCACEQARRQKLDFLLFPFARNFGDGSFDQDRWDRDELNAYTARVASVGATTLMTNALESPATDDYPSFGGAWVIRPDGVVMARQALGRAGTLIVDV